LTLVDGMSFAQTDVMFKATKRVATTAALLATLYAARQYFRNWGATKTEAQLRLPGDALVGDPAVQTTEAVDIDVPANAVWTYLLRIAQDRAEGLQNLTGESRPLAVGDVLRWAPPGWVGLGDGLTLRVAEIVPEKHVVLTAMQPNLRWSAVWSIHLQPHWDDRVRLLARLRIALRYPGEVLVTELASPLLALGSRGLLLGIKHRAERLPVTEPAHPRPAETV
jgi:hypothetical protein